MPGARARAQESPGSAGKGTKAGMSMKMKDMSICDRPIKDLGNQDVGDFAPRDAGETNPRGLRYVLSIRYKNSDPNKPNPLIFLAIYALQRKSASFSANMNANDPSRILSVNPSMLPRIPR